MLKILIVRLSSLGDIIHTYPMVYDIKKTLAECSIDWLVDESFAEVVELNPLVDNVITIPLRQWKKNKSKFWFNFKNWRNKSRNLEYDYIIDVQGLVKSAILAKCFTGKICGLGKKSIRERFAGFMYHARFETGKNMLALTKSRLLAAAIFNYKLDLDKVNFGLEHVKYPALSIANKYVIFFHATSKESKKYPMDAWAELANYLIKQYNLTIILPFGSTAEKEDSLMIQHLVNSPSVIVPSERFNYHELSGLISHAEFVFGVDTGLIHLANALNKKLIGIYVDTDPKKTGIFESNIAKNSGNINQIPRPIDLINLFTTIIKA